MCIKQIDTTELAGKKHIHKNNLREREKTNFFIYSKAGINQHDTYRSHHGMVTGLDFHPLHGPVDFSDLYLTSSVDWTVKLWRAKVNKKKKITFHAMILTCL